MAVRKIHTDTDCVYFITFTCYKWIDLFEKVKLYDEIYAWFEIVRSKGGYIVGYVIMPNHLHMLLYASSKFSGLNKIIANGKRFLAYEIVARLGKMNYSGILKKLGEEVSKTEEKKGKKHQVFQPSFDARVCFSHEMLVQKLNYIHHNPVDFHNPLVSDYTNYIHSSAAFYELGATPLTEILHYKEI